MIGSRLKALISACLAIAVVLLLCSLGQSAESDEQWDGVETVTFVVIVRDTVTKGVIDGADVTLQRLHTNVPKPYDHSVTTAKTEAGVATVKGTFWSGGAHTDEGYFSNLAIRGATLRCSAEGYQPGEEHLAPVLHFKPKEPRIQLIVIYLKPQ